MNPLAEFKLAGIVLAVAALIIGALELRHAERAVGAQECQAATAKAVAAAQQAASATEDTWKAKVLDVHRQAEIQVENIAAERDAALASLRNRPARRADLPASAAAACSGARGADLSVEDSTFLVGLAAEADRLRAAYDELWSWAQTVKGQK